MKSKVTLLSTMLLITAFSFGQTIKPEKHRKFEGIKAEIYAKATLRQCGLYKYERVMQQNKLNRESNMLKSAQATKQRLDSFILKDWDESTSQWVAYNKDEYTYDANERQSLYSYWDRSTSQWVADFKVENTYDANGNMTQFLGSYWDERTSQWVASFKEENTYDANGNMTQSLDSDWDERTSQWVADYKEENTYDANGNMTQSLYSNWVVITSQWVADYKEENTYDANGNMTQSLYSDWDEFISQWVADYKEEYTYDANGNMTQFLYSDWDERTSQWVADDKREYTYDANGNMTQSLYTYWDERTSQWVADYKVENTYDNTYTFSDLILPYEPYSKHMLTGFISYNMDTNDTWVQMEKGVYYYSKQNITGIKNTATDNVGLYPNPVTDYLNVSFAIYSNSATFELFDMQGRKLMSMVITNKKQLSLEGLTRGIYFYNLNIDGEIKSGKLIKE